MKRIRNKKGSALILVLSSLIILMAVSSVVIMLSGANIMMSRNYSDWSEEFYWLDYAAQDRLGDLDQRVLSEAEGAARNYVQNCFFEEETTPGFGGLFLGNNGSLQTLVYNEWAQIASLLDTEDQEEEDEPVDINARMEEYRDKMETFVPQVFQAVYLAYIDGHLQSCIDLMAAEENPYAPYNITVLTEKDAWQLSADSYDTFGELYQSMNNDKPGIVITASEDIGVPAKKVRVSVTVKAPSFNAVEQTKLYAVQANPLYANALTVQGRIRFSSGIDAEITGDVVSLNRNPEGALYSISEGNGDGITAMGGADVIINGNVYSAGDLHLSGGNSSITVNHYDPYSAYPQALKTHFIFNNNYWFDASVSGGFEAFAEGIVPEGKIPYIFDDSLGGNVYCNNLSIESGAAQNAYLKVSGNVWTQDDIQNDGQTNTHITVEGTFIGMNSDALDGDPNGSSAVINNAYPFGGTISLGDKFVIPGTAFYMFDVAGRPQDPYQTAESISVKAGEYFQIYIVEEDDEAPSKSYYLTAEEFYNLFEGSIEDKTAWFDAHYSDALYSNVSVKSDEYYILGVGVVMLDGSMVLLSSYNNDQNLNNYYDYSNVSENILPGVFESKTRYFGTNGLTVSDLTDNEYGINDKSRYFYYFEGDTNLNLSGDKIKDHKGIIFCTGDLTLTGTEPFYGSVICLGDLTIQSNVTIIHDEIAIKEVMGFNKITERYDTLLGSKIARRFFSPPGYMAAGALWAEEYTYISTSAGEKEVGVITRYIINSWREMNKHS